MAQTKKPENKNSKELANPKETEVKPTKKPSTLARHKPQRKTNLDQAFDQAIDRFRQDFEDLLFPYEEIVVFPEFPEVRTPVVDLQDREKDFLLRAEMPGFKKDDVEIAVQDDGVEISAVSGWKYDQKEESYICTERACKSFYRYVDLPEEIKVDDVAANLSDGVLEVTLPKKTIKPQKQKRKVQVK
jgi:HSP20 family molecular chaperone IbpA